MIPRRRASLIAAVVAAVLLAGGGAMAARAPTDSPPRPAPRVPAPAPEVLDTTIAASTPEAPRLAPPARSACPAEAVEGDALASPSTASAGLRASLATALADPGFAGVTVGASFWVEEYGEVLAHQDDLALHPGSNQKLLTGMGALAVFEPDDAFQTTVVGRAVDGTVDGDLVLVAGGDPTLTAGGPHSLDALAAQVRAAGITRVAGGVVADASHHETTTVAPGWQDWQVPTYVGPMSALMVDDNRHRRDATYLADPAAGNAEVFRAALIRRGVAVAGGVRSGGTAPTDAAVLASLTSAPMPALIADMMLRSDNETAEMITRQAGIEVGAVDAGTTPAGTAALTEALTGLCVLSTGIAADGSGLSRQNLRSAGEWRTLLQAARGTAWWPAFHDALPLGGRTGTLGSRFLGTAAEANVRAKTGTIIGGRALSGYLTTAGGRQAVFSIVVNGDGWRTSLGAMDRLVATVAADAS